MQFSFTCLIRRFENTSLHFAGASKLTAETRLLTHDRPQVHVSRLNNKYIYLKKKKEMTNNTLIRMQKFTKTLSIRARKYKPNTSNGEKNAPKHSHREKPPHNCSNLGNSWLFPTLQTWPGSGEQDVLTQGNKWRQDNMKHSTLTWPKTWPKNFVHDGNWRYWPG